MSKTGLQALPKVRRSMKALPGLTWWSASSGPTMNTLRRGAFRSVAELTQAIEEHITHQNADPKPFVWTAAASDILEKVKRGRKKLHKVQSA